MRTGFGELLRHKVRERLNQEGKSVTRLAKELGIVQTCLNDFVNFGKWLNGKNIDKLVDYLGLEVVEKN